MAAMEDTNSTSSPHSRHHQADMANSMAATLLLLLLLLLPPPLLPPLATPLSSRLPMPNTTVTNTVEVIISIQWMVGIVKIRKYLLLLTFIPYRSSFLKNSLPLRLYYHPSCLISSFWI